MVEGPNHVGLVTAASRHRAQRAAGMTAGLGWARASKGGRLRLARACCSVTLLTALAVTALLYNSAPFSCKVGLLPQAASWGWAS